MVVVVVVAEEEEEELCRRAIIIDMTILAQGCRKLLGSTYFESAASPDVQAHLPMV